MSVKTVERGITVPCPCGEVYVLRPEYAGRLLECPGCNRRLRAGRAPQAAAPAPPTGGDPVFAHDVFLLHQRALAIESKYEVLDRVGRPLVYIERPTYLGRTLLAFLAATIAAVVVMVGTARVSGAAPEVLAAPVSIARYVLTVTVFMVVSMSLRPLRHVTVYRTESRAERLLEIRQDQRVAFLNRTYTVRLPDGTPLARLRKSYLHNVLRKRWYVHAPDGRLTALALEDSVILSLLRRVIGSFFGFLRTNFLLVWAGTGEAFGEFNRKFTLLDRYVLDLSGDPGRALDRRVALGLGVMLDTGERR